MRKLVLLILLAVGSGHLMAQLPPRIEWLECYGGTGLDGASDIKPTPDGGFIIAGTTRSLLPGHHGIDDALIIKIDAVGNVQWQKCYGGSQSDLAHCILLTPDGGYIFAGQAESLDGDVIGQHGNGLSPDVWIVKLDAAGNIQWQKCYGGSQPDLAHSIAATPDGGYIVGGLTRSFDGDVTGLHSAANDHWILKLDNNGNLQWQKCFGGSGPDDQTFIIPVPSGGYIFTANYNSPDGDVPCDVSVADEAVIVKLDNAGNIEWTSCTIAIIATWISVTSDGGFITGGWATPLSLAPREAWAIKLDAGGNIQWQKTYGGSGDDIGNAIRPSAGGGYLFSGSTSSPEIAACNEKGQQDVWIFKLDDNGVILWQKRFGGNADDYAGLTPFDGNILELPDGSVVAVGTTYSNDGDITKNKGMLDIWVAKLVFPGEPILPEITIAADENIICPGGKLNFTATIVNGGDDPSYQWKVNGTDIPVAINPATIQLLNDGDIIECVLTSSSSCVTTPTATSNLITIQTDPSLLPTGFLPPDAEKCVYGTLELRPTGNFESYLWNTNDITPALNIINPGTYWLEAITEKGCKGRDTTVVTPKECLKGFYMPTAFTPNGDGKNDVLQPTVGGILKQFKLSIYNRWGQLIFQSNDPSRSWNGSWQGKEQDNHVFIWFCTYQFEGEAARTEKGTVVLIK